MRTATSISSVAGRLRVAAEVSALRSIEIARPVEDVTRACAVTVVLASCGRGAGAASAEIGSTVSATVAANPATPARRFLERAAASVGSI